MKKILLGAIGAGVVGGGYLISRCSEDDENAPDPNSDIHPEIIKAAEPTVQRGYDFIEKKYKELRELGTESRSRLDALEKQDKEYMKNVIQNLAQNDLNNLALYQFLDETKTVPKLLTADGYLEHIGNARYTEGARNPSFELIAEGFDQNKHPIAFFSHEKDYYAYDSSLYIQATLSVQESAKLALAQVEPMAYNIAGYERDEKTGKIARDNAFGGDKKDNIGHDTATAESHYVETDKGGRYETDFWAEKFTPPKEPTPELENNPV